ncbi:MAG: AI-2E family transporter [Gemmatimonadaceae bacterium]
MNIPLLPEKAAPPSPVEAMATASAPNQDSPRHGWLGSDIFRAATIILAVWVSGQLLWHVYDLIFLIFLGTLFGLAVASGVDVLERFHIRRGVGSALIVITAVGALGGTLAWAGPTLVDQSAELQVSVPAAVQKLQDWVDSRRGGFVASVIQSAAAPPAGSVAAQTQPVPTTAAAKRRAEAASLPSVALKQKITDVMGGLSKYLFSLVSSTIAMIGALFMLIFLSIYIGAEPDVYRGWILSVIPAQRRAYMRLVLGEMSSVLRKWLVTQMVAMLLIGVACTVVLLILGVKAPYALGIIAGLLEFVPTIGPIMSAVPAVLMGFVDSPSLALYVLIAYWGVQFVENNLLIPFLMRGEMDLPPAITLVAQALMTFVFGFFGLLIAVPFTAAVLVPIRMVAVRENAREKQMMREARIAKAQATLDSESAEDTIEDADKGPTSSSIRATTRGRVAQKSVELGNLTAEMAIPKRAKKKAPMPETKK